MGKKIKLFYVPRGNLSIKEISFSKKAFYSAVIMIALLSILGFYLAVSGIIFEKMGSSVQRKKMARENFELTEKILELKKPYSHLKLKLADLHKEKEKTIICM